MAAEKSLFITAFKLSKQNFRIFSFQYIKEIKVKVSAIVRVVMWKSKESIPVMKMKIVWDYFSLIGIPHIITFIRLVLQRQDQFWREKSSISYGFYFNKVEKFGVFTLHNQNKWLFDLLFLPIILHHQDFFLSQHLRVYFARPKMFVYVFPIYLLTVFLSLQDI